MPRSRLLALTFSICLMGNAVSASAQVRPPEAAPAQPAGEDLPAGLIPPPLPQQPLAAELTPPGFAAEFAQRLSTDGRLRVAEKADRIALQQFYAERQNEPVWVTPTGFSPAAMAVRAEIARADDVGSRCLGFPPSGAGPGRRADARPARRGRDSAQSGDSRVRPSRAWRSYQPSQPQPQPGPQAAASRPAQRHRSGSLHGQPRRLSARPASAASAIRTPASGLPFTETKRPSAGGAGCPNPRARANRRRSALSPRLRPARVCARCSSTWSSGAGCPKTWAASTSG